MNYIGAIVNILEPPQQIIVKDNISLTRFRAQLCQVHETQVVHIVIWGNLADDIIKYYDINDYILIEGYVSVPSFPDLESGLESLNNIQITVLKIYPVLLSPT